MKKISVVNAVRLSESTKTLIIGVYVRVAKSGTLRTGHSRIWMIAANLNGMQIFLWSIQSRFETGWV